MKRSWCVIFTIVLGATACKGASDKKSGSAASGSAAPAAGSAAPAAGSAAAPTAPPPTAPAPTAPAAGPATLTGKRAGGDLGPFDGDKAIYIKKDADRMILIPRNCPTFDCSLSDKTSPDREGINFGKLRKDCPDISWMRILLNGSSQPGEPVVGATKVQVQAGGFSGGGDITGEWTEGGSITEVTADRIAGKVDVKSGEDEARGTFVAKICP